MSVNILIKKRDQLNQKIAEFQKLEKRKIAVANIAHKSKILNLPDDFLKNAFEQIALSYQNGVSAESQNANSQFQQGGQND
ncbi:MAG: hypothetical protein ABL868_05320 [Sulfuriferula sp.]